ncbi:MAG: PAS domain S-box protein [candidate division KSB1 bacterium]|nr:PAS domain S-box protein [candidate division KSB1 bacterium]
MNGQHKTRNRDESKLFQDNIIDHSPIAMWVSDAEGTVVRTNQSLCEITNLSKESIVGKYNVFKDKNLATEELLPKIKDVFEKQKTTHSGGY